MCVETERTSKPMHRCCDGFRMLFGADFRVQICCVRCWCSRWLKNNRVRPDMCDAVLYIYLISVFANFGSRGIIQKQGHTYSLTRRCGCQLELLLFLWGVHFFFGAGRTLSINNIYIYTRLAGKTHYHHHQYGRTATQTQTTHSKVCINNKEPKNARHLYLPIFVVHCYSGFWFRPISYIVYKCKCFRQH